MGVTELNPSGVTLRGAHPPSMSSKGYTLSHEIMRAGRLVRHPCEGLAKRKAWSLPAIRQNGAVRGSVPRARRICTSLVLTEWHEGHAGASVVSESGHAARPRMIPRRGRGEDRSHARSHTEADPRPTRPTYTLVLLLPGLGPAINVSRHVGSVPTMSPAALHTSILFTCSLWRLALMTLVVTARALVVAVEENVT